ncbi:SUKH-3 domain-containing protein [Streptomyces bobili]|uniref:SUKH-3 domain-containing protein n=1 Tax=Streptomyces bobili TaxID=67280 RepID=UPI003798F29C
MTLWGNDPSVREALLRAGWSEGRRIDISRWVEMLGSVGYDPHPLALRIWTEFGGLTILSVQDREPASSLHVDPVDACVDSFEESVRIGGRYGEDFSPLGMWSVQFRSYMSASGKVVAVTVGTIWELGTSFSEALDYVVKGDGGESRAQSVDWLT